MATSPDIIYYARPTRTRIAHLSDLHCNDSAEWARNFDAVCALLREAKVHAVLITGDCADQPKKRYYSILRARLESLSNELQEASEAPIPILVIPGNHDYSFWGNRVGLPISRHFDDGLGAFLANGVLLRADLASFAQMHRIVIYPFDSNRTSIGRIAFARGRVDHPHKTFTDLTEKYRRAFRERSVEWDDCLRIAILHHHPLPLPDTVKGERLESFHILDNANEFLRAACESDVHLILHGHKHVSGMAEYRYGDATRASQSVCVSACGTSAHTKASEREVCLFDVLPSGTVTVNRVVAKASDPKFSYSDEDPTREVIRYAYRRKRRASRATNWPRWEQRIKSVGTKTKVVRILDNGRAYVKITLDDLQWSRHSTGGGPILQEFLHAGIGRIAGGWATYRDDHGQQFGKVYPLERSEIKRNELDAFEGMKYELPELDRLGTPSRFELKYVVHNGYALTVRDYQESYFTDAGTSCEENSTIEALVPTETAELIVTFPAGCLPPEEHVHLDAWLLPGGQPTQSLDIVHRKYHSDADEKAFLEEKGAIRYRPELNQVAAVIRHPQPGTAYTLRWSLGGGLPAEQLSYPPGFHEFRRQLGTLTSAQHRTIEQAIRRGLRREDVDVALFVYMPPLTPSCVGKMKLVQPHGLCCSIYVGRGLVGKAFRSRQAQHYTVHPLPSSDRRAGHWDTQTMPGLSLDNIKAQAANCEPLDPDLCELLAVPLIVPHQTPKFDETAADVAGMLLIVRRAAGEGASENNVFTFDMISPEGRIASDDLVHSLVGIVRKVLDTPANG